MHINLKYIPDRLIIILSNNPKYILPGKNTAPTVSPRNKIDLFHMNPSVLRYPTLPSRATLQQTPTIDSQPTLLISTTKTESEPRPSLKNTCSFFSKVSTSRQNSLMPVIEKESPANRQLSVDFYQIETGRTSLFSYISCPETAGTSCTELLTPEQHRLYYPGFLAHQAERLIEQYQSLAQESGYSYHEADGFSWFTHFPADADADELNNSLVSKGLKFHVSLSHDPLLYELGTSIVIQTLIEAKHSYFKVVHPLLLSSEKYAEAGREITIYTCKDTEPPVLNSQFNLHWSTLLRTIVTRLTDASITPYIDANQRIIPPKKDTIILNLHGFVTWRNDKQIYSLTQPKHPITPLHPAPSSHPDYRSY